MAFAQKLLSLLVCLTLIFATIPFATQTAAQEEYAPMSADDLDSIVAPIALYPDELVAQVLGAATYPDQVTEANDWLRANPSLQGMDLMQAADQQNWDDSVKAITLFPSVVELLADNLAWTSALGEAAATQQADVMAAIQRMRAKAFQAGNLQTTEKIKVVQQSPGVIVIQPANPQVVYVPTYNPTVVYGAPVVVPGYSSADLVATTVISFGVGIAIGSTISNRCCGWGWHGWGMHWHGGSIYYHNRVYYGNPYWHGRPPGYYPGYRPPYYPPHPPYPGGRPPRPTPYPGGGGRPPVTSPRPPGGGLPPIPPPGGARPPGGGSGGGGRPPGGGSRPPGGGGPGRPGGPSIQPVPAPGGPGNTRPAPQPRPSPRPSPAVPMPGQKDLRGYGSSSGSTGNRGAFAPSPSDRSASMRGNQSLGNTRPAPKPAPAKPGSKPAAPSPSAPRKR